jgi:glycosyltransferase involved in cell wall biosynthesis
MIRISLCITTYNNSDDVCTLLFSLKAQQKYLTEILICDDGSSLDHQERIKNSLRACIHIPWRYVWHDDRGWRLSRIRNLGISKSSGDYIIFVDGDCIPHPKFMLDYTLLAARNEVLIGQRVHVRSQYRNHFLNASLYSRLKSLALGRLKKARYTFRNPTESGNLILSQSHLASPVAISGIGLGCNHGFWKEDAMLIKGYDELFTAWGPEDSDFVFRLMTAGLRVRTLKRRCLVFHLDHDSNVAKVRDADAARNGYRLMRSSYMGQRSVASHSILKDLE